MFEPPGLVASVGCRPMVATADGASAPATRLGGVVEDEALDAAGGDARAKTLHVVVIGDTVALGGQRQAAGDGIGETQLCLLGPVRVRGVNVEAFFCYLESCSTLVKETM